MELTIDELARKAYKVGDEVKLYDDGMRSAAEVAVENNREIYKRGAFDALDEILALIKGNIDRFGISADAALCEIEKTISRMKYNFKDGDIIIKDGEGQKYGVKFAIARYRGVNPSSSGLLFDASYIEWKNGNKNCEVRDFISTGLGDITDFRPATDEEREFFNEQLKNPCGYVRAE